MKKLILGLMLSTALVAPALADSTHDTTNTGDTVTQNNDQTAIGTGGTGIGQGGAGGAGGAGGSAAAAATGGTGGNASNVNVNAPVTNNNVDPKITTSTSVGVDNKSYNTNINTSDSRSSSSSGAASFSGVSGSGNSSVRDSGNSHSTSGASAVNGPISNTLNPTTTSAASNNASNGNVVDIKTPRSASTAYAPDVVVQGECERPISLGFSTLLFGGSLGFTHANDWCRGQAQDAQSHRFLMEDADFILKAGAPYAALNLLCEDAAVQRRAFFCQPGFKWTKENTAPAVKPYVTMPPVGH